MLVLSALLDKLVANDILTVDERKEISNLYELSSLLEGKVGKLFNDVEQIYIERMTKLLEEGDIKAIKSTIPPKTLTVFHGRLKMLAPVIIGMKDQEKG